MTDGQTTDQPKRIEAIPHGFADAPSLGIPNSSEGILVNDGTASLQQHHLDFAQFHEGYLSKYIALADTKAGLVFGLTSGLIGYFLSKDALRAILFAPNLSPGFVLLSTTFLMLAISALCSFLVIAPRLASRHPKGVVFFGSVAEFPTSHDFVIEISKKSSTQITNARLQHCFEIARICTKKYNLLSSAMWLTLCAVLSSFFVIFGLL